MLAALQLFCFGLRFMHSVKWVEIQEKASFVVGSRLLQLARCSAVSVSLSLVLLMTGCGGTGQDEGSPSGFSQRYSGLALDGYLARATVFVDSNNNGSRDAWEPWAFTDNDGYYSFNPKTNTNYCGALATAQQAQYCLISNVEYTNVVIRIDAGYDVITGEPFLGQMSRRVNADVQEEVTNSVVSPITSLLSDVETSADRASLLESLQISEADLDVDYLSTDGSGAVDASLLSAALKIHKVVAVLADRLTDTYTEIGEDYGTPNDASSSVYSNLALQIISAGTSLDVALADQSTLVSVLDAAEATLREVYERKEFTLPEDMGSVSSPGAFNRVAEVAAEFTAVINTLIDVTDATFSLADATGSTRALEALVIKTINEGSTSDPSIDNVITFFGTSTNEALVDSLLTSLSLDSADISALSENDFTGDDFDSVEEVSDASSLGDDVVAFTQIGGLQIRVSDLDLGSAPADLDDAELEFYFDGEPSDVDGSFIACVKFIDDANIDGSLGEGNTRGELISGFWSLLGATESNVESYSLLITPTFLGTTYQAIMKPAGVEIIEGVEYDRLRFDYDGELNAWHSALGFTSVESIPTTNEACQQRLPSRVGL